MDFVIPNQYHSPSTKDGYAVIWTGTCKLLGFVVENTSASTVYVQVHDGYVQPTAGTVPLLSIKALAGSQVCFDASAVECVELLTGCVVAVSSTGPTYTDTTTKDLFMTVFTTA